MLGKQKPDIANVKRRLDNVFGSYNKFTEFISSRTGSSIYGVPSSTSFSALEDKKPYPSNSYSVNTYPLNNHNKSITQIKNFESTASTNDNLKKNTELYELLPKNDHLKKNIVRPPTKEVLQSMRGLVKDDLLKNLDFSTDVCVAADNLTPSTSKISEKNSKCSAPIINNEIDRKRLFCNNTKSIDVKTKKFKKDEKNDSPKYSTNKSNVDKSNRDVQIELFGDFVSDDEEIKCKEKKAKLKTNIVPTLGLSTESLLMPRNRISPLSQALVPEKDKKSSYKILNETLKNNLVLPHKEDSVVKNNDSNSPRLIIRIPRPAFEAVAIESSSLQRFDGIENYPNLKNKKDKDHKFKNTEKNKLLSISEKNKKEKEFNIKNCSTSSKINNSTKSENIIKSNTRCTVSPESNDLQSPDSGFVDMISNGTSFGSSSTAVIKSNNVCGVMDNKTNIKTIMENLGRVSPLLSPIRSLSSLLIEPSTSFLSTKSDAKIESPINMPYNIKKNEKTNQNSFLSSNKKDKVLTNDLSQIKILQKPTAMFSKFNNDIKNFNKDFPCRMKISPFLAKFFGLKVKDKSAKKEANKSNIKLESVNSKKKSSESNLLNNQALFDQQIKIKEEIIQNHEILITEQREQLKNFEEKTKMYIKELENSNKLILTYKDENEKLLKSNVLITERADYLANELEKLSNELNTLKNRQIQCCI